MKHNLELTARDAAEPRAEAGPAHCRGEEAAGAGEAAGTVRPSQALLWQWCANCKKGGYLLLGWNTSYCDYPCQKAHWLEHMGNLAPSQLPPLSREADSEVNTKTLTNPRVPPLVFRQLPRKAAPGRRGFS